MQERNWALRRGIITISLLSGNRTEEKGASTLSVAVLSRVLNRIVLSVIFISSSSPSIFKRDM